MQADAERDVGGERQSGRGAVSPTDSEQHQKSQRRSNRHHDDALQGRRGLDRELHRFFRGIGDEEHQQPDRQGKHEVQSLATQAAHRRVKQHSDDDGHDADEHAKQRLRAKLSAVWSRSRDRNVDVALERRAGLGQDLDLVLFAQHPGIGNVQPCARQVVERASGTLGESPIGFIDLDLGDRDRLRAAGAQLDVNSLTVEDDALEGNLLDRRRPGIEDLQPAACDQPDRRRSERQQRHDEPQHVGQRAARPCVACRPLGHHRVGTDDLVHDVTSRTSNMPIQPSSANSDWCAWNMYSPGSWLR